MIYSIGVIKIIQCGRLTTELAGWLAGGPLLRVARIRRTTDIPFHFPHNECTPVQIALQYLHFGVRIIKEMPGSVASGTHCIMQYNIICTCVFKPAQ